MRDKLLSYANTGAIFALGLSGSGIIFLLQFVYTGVRYGRTPAMSGWNNSWPWNAFAIGFFVVSLAYIVWFAHRQAKKDRQTKEEDRALLAKALKDAVKEAMTEAKSESVVSNGQTKSVPK